MTIELWDWLEHLDYLVGTDFPAADEDALRRCGQAWSDAAVGLRALVPDAVTVGSQVSGALSGDSARAFGQSWNQLAGSDSYLAGLTALCEQLAAACDGTADEIEYAKLEYIGALVALGVTLAALIGSLVAGGVSALGIPAAIAGAQFTIRLLLTRLVAGIVAGVVFGTGMDVVAQLIQVADGHRDTWDWSKTLHAAGSGAIYGALAGAAFAGAGRLAALGSGPGRLGLLGAAAATGGIGAIVAPLASGQSPTLAGFAMSTSAGLFAGLASSHGHAAAEVPEHPGLAALDARLAAAGQPDPLVGGDWFDPDRAAPASDRMAVRDGLDPVPDGTTLDGAVIRAAPVDQGWASADPRGPAAVPDPRVRAAIADPRVLPVVPDTGVRAAIGDIGVPTGVPETRVPAVPESRVPAVLPGSVAAHALRDRPAGDAPSPAHGSGSSEQAAPASSATPVVPPTSPGPRTDAGAVVGGRVEAAPQPVGAFVAGRADPATAHLAGAHAGWAADGSPHAHVEPVVYGQHPEPSSVGLTRRSGTDLAILKDDAVSRLAQRAEVVEPTLTELTTDVADRVGGRLAGLDHVRKDWASLRERLDRFRSDGRAESGRYAAQRLAGIRDSVRYTIVLPEDRYRVAAQAAIDDLLDRGLRPVAQLRSWDPASGYLGLNTSWFHPGTGHIFEVQLHTDATFAAKTDNYPRYAQLRELTRSDPLRVALAEAQRQRLVGVRIPAGAAEVGIPDSVVRHRPGPDPVLSRTGPLWTDPEPRHAVTDVEAVALVRQHVTPTPAGFAFYPDSDVDIRAFAAVVQPVAGHLTLDLHGSATGFQIGSGLLTPQQFGRALRGLADDGVLDLTGTTRIKLLSCDTAYGGEQSAAAVLARELGVELVAPDRPVWTALDGDEVVSSPVWVFGNVQPMFPPDGHWHRFSPTGTELPLDAFPAPP